ncbi:hypothetical protein WJX75_001698 [Coccomyxa subellipsoidea]|uniref:AGC-kinase C-terminal domain-containing protein n=1 Tax=Coccomyxa subellipsoidea TaxID=248742 RepID=A0ABR2YZV6_9CHLO
MQTDPEDRAFTRPWEREVSFDLGRAYSGSDLPNFGGLIAPVGTTPDRATPPLVPASPAFLEDYSPKA